MNLTFYEPPMCCPTGVCGPSVDEKLVSLVEQIAELEAKFSDLTVERFMISTNPFKFSENADVFSLIKEKGKDILPITTLNGQIIKSSEYPTMEEMLRHMENLK